MLTGAWAHSEALAHVRECRDATPVVAARRVTTIASRRGFPRQGRDIMTIRLLSALVSAGLMAVAGCSHSQDRTTTPPVAQPESRDTGKSVAMAHPTTENEDPPAETPKSGSIDGVTSGMPAEKTAPPPNMGTPGMTSGTANAPTEAQIAHVAHTANQVDIDAAKLAKTRSKNAKVKQFADEMIRDHTALDREGDQLAAKLGVTPQDNPTSHMLKSDGERTMLGLKSLKGAAFDKAYVHAQVASHKTVLDTLDNMLIPNAKSPELKDLLTRARAKVSEHLDHAQALATSLGG
jgi:putative membrane protein